MPATNDELQQLLAFDTIVDTNLGGVYQKPEHVTPEIHREDSTQSSKTSHNERNKPPRKPTSPFIAWDRPTQKDDEDEEHKPKIPAVFPRHIPDPEIPGPGDPFFIENSHEFPDIPPDDPREEPKIRKEEPKKEAPEADYYCVENEQEQILDAISTGIWKPICEKGHSHNLSIKWSDWT